jgi:Cu-processing system permease protein
VDQGRTLTPGAVNALLMVNPTDVYRMFNLASFANVSVFSGMAGLAGAIAVGPATLLAALAAWALIPLALAVLAFSRREL